MQTEARLEVVLLLVAIVPVGRLLCKSPVRREARDHPWIALGLAGVVCTASVALVWMAVRSPAFLRLSVALVLATAALTHVRARPSYGRRRQLPPGSLGFGVSLDAIACEDFYAQAVRRWGPIFKMSQFHRPVVCIADLEQGLEFVRAHAASLEQLSLPYDEVIPGGYIEFMNGHHHEHYREILRRPLNGAVIASCKEPVAAIMRRGLSAIADGSPRSPDASLAHMASASLLRVFFGVAPDSADAELLHRQFADLDRRTQYPSGGRHALKVDVERIVGIVRTLAGGEQHATSVLSELCRLSPEALDDPTVIWNLVFMVRDARSTLAGMLRWTLKLSCDHPRWTPELRREYDANGDAVAARFVKELLRLWQSEYVYRRTLLDCRVGPFRIPKGWVVRVCLREAHGRADVFPDPAAFDPGRFAERAYEKHEYAPFSDGPHACFGAALTTTVAKVFLQELAAGFDSRVVADGRVERGNRHWDHWRPSRDLRVAFTAR